MGYVKSVEIHEEEDYMATAVMRFTERMEVLSNAPLNGGTVSTDCIFIMQVPHKWDCMDYMAVLKDKVAQYSLPEDSVGFMTAAEVKYVFTSVDDTVPEGEVSVMATAGVTNCVCAGDELDRWEERTKRSAEITRRLLGGTINIVAVAPVPLSEPGKVNLMIPLVEGKSLGMRDRGYEETGTTSDAMAVVCPIGEDRVEFTGTGTNVGMAVGRSVRKAVAECLRKRGESAEPRDALTLLGKAGVTCEMLWECASACGIGEAVKEEFFDILRSMAEDTDICTLVYGYMVSGRLADCGCIYGQMDGETPDVLVDGTLAMFLAGKISESRGGDATIDLVRMHPLNEYRISDYVENLTYGLVAGVVGYMTGFSDD